MAKIIGNAGNIALCTPKTTEAIIKLWDKHVIQGKGWDSDSLTLVINAASYSITSILAAKNLGETFGNIRGELTDIVTSQCFIAGTLVLTEDGEKPIEDIEVGDYVYASDPETGESGYKEVLQTFVNESSELVHIHVNGDEIVSTPTHPFYSPQRGWTSAVDLKAGDILVLSNGDYVVVEQVQHEILEAPVKVYNFEVQDFHTYYVGKNSVLVHNYCPTDKNNNNSKRSKPVNRASPKKVTIDMEEVLSGHTSNGYRAKQSNIKDLFPDSMSEKQIKNEIIEAYKNAKQVGKPQYDYDSSRIKLQGKGFNGYVEMWYNVTTKTIETAYPIYGKKVRIN